MQKRKYVKNCVSARAKARARAMRKHRLEARNKRYGCKVCADFKAHKCDPRDEETVCRYAKIFEQYESYEEYDEAMLRDCVSLLLKIPAPERR